MKLYATVTSERATKGQGGEYLDIDITDSNEEIIAQFRVRTKNDGHGLIYYIDTVIREDVYVDGHHWIDSEIVTKGEKQKGELCPKYNDIVLPDENGKCSLCGLHNA